jgi:hypothetical protein
LHNDQLAVELSIAENDLVSDPGSYLYTASPHTRNRYRSVHAHFTPWPDEKEPARLDGGLFQHSGYPRAAVLYFGSLGFAGELRIGEATFVRHVAVEAKQVTVIDYASSSTYSEKAQPCFLTAFSPGYGILSRPPG